MLLCLSATLKFNSIYECSQCKAQAAGGTVRLEFRGASSEELKESIDAQPRGSHHMPVGWSYNGKFTCEIARLEVDMFAFIRKLFTKKPKLPRETCFVRYAEADALLRRNNGWRIAPEEDNNKAVGWVYLDRDMRKCDGNHAEPQCLDKECWLNGFEVQGAIPVPIIVDGVHLGWGLKRADAKEGKNDHNPDKLQAKHGA